MAQHSQAWELHGAKSAEVLFPTNTSANETLVVPCSKKIQKIMKATRALANSNNQSGELQTMRLNYTMLACKDQQDVEVGTIQDMEAIMSQNETAEIASRSGEIITANDMAGMIGGFRGEEFGASGAFNTFQGDMIPENDEQLKLFMDLAREPKQIAAGRAWPKGRVQYCFAADVSMRVRHLFRLATQQYMKAVPCLTFIDVGWQAGTSQGGFYSCQSSPAIFVTSNPQLGCFSSVGMLRSTAQQLQLHDPGCMLIGTVLHELGHALGMAHEQSRPDRKKHLRVNYKNVQHGREINFDIDPEGYTAIPYDFLSVMHYDAYAFAKDPSKPTLQRIDGSHGPMGQRVALSAADVTQVANMYEPELPGCSAKSFAGTGCVDAPDAYGNYDCPKGLWCTPSRYSNCCACRGGTSVQCYAGAECPTRVLTNPVKLGWPGILLLLAMLALVWQMLRVVCIK